MLGATLLLTVAVFTLLWLQYRSGHATSTNAAVRGHVAEIGTRIGGRIASVAVDVGDRVETGQVLVQLEDRHLLAELEEARAKVAAARVQVEAARRTHAMQRELYEVGGASRAELNGADSERRVREADVLAAQARVTRAETELESAAIRAPQSGAIVRRIVQPGGAVEAGQPVVAMWLGTDVWVEAWIDEEDLGLIRRGGPASVTFHAFPGQEFTGVVERVGLATDLELPDSVVPQPRFARMRTAPVVGVRIRLDAPPPHLLPGLSASVAIRKE
jgi:RND family efflux transporter MFP subunit